MVPVRLVDCALLWDMRFDCQLGTPISNDAALYHEIGSLEVFVNTTVHRLSEIRPAQLDWHFSLHSEPCRSLPWVTKESSK